MDCSRRHEQDVARLDPSRRPALDLVLERSFEDIDDLLPRMSVLWKYTAGIEIDANLDDFAAGRTEIAATRFAWLPAPGRAWRQASPHLAA